jgi:DNA-binding response OmpR family regulator
MSDPRPILIVDDDPALRATLSEQLAVEGEFAPREAGSMAEAGQILMSDGARFDAVLLDIGLPDGDGRDLCAELRRAGIKVPIIMLTGQDAEQDIVRGLDAGANDYIAKPINVDKLVSLCRVWMPK